MDIRGTYATGKGPKDTSNSRGCCHSKLNLIRYATHLRVMITSSNPQMGEWHGAVGQIVWCCDMPKRGRTLSTSSNSSKPHSFANDLSKYLEKMFDNKHPHLYQKWQQYIVSEYDFNVCGNKTHLVCSCLSSAKNNSSFSSYLYRYIPFDAGLCNVTTTGSSCAMPTTTISPSNFSVAPFFVSEQGIISIFGLS